MNAQHAFVSLVLIAALVGLAFLGLSFGHALKQGDMALWGRHPMLGSGMASLITAVLGGLFVGWFSRAGPDTDH